MFRAGASVERQDLRGNSIKEVAVVTDRDDSPFVGIERFLQRFTRGNIQMICRFVED